MSVAQLDADLKLLVDARDQLVAEATRVRNRLHALLLAIAPGYRDDTGALSSKASLATAKRLVFKGRSAEPVRAKLALAAITRLHQLTNEADELEADITSAVKARNPSHLLAICGVGHIIAAKILGETRVSSGSRRPPHSPPIQAPALFQRRAARPAGTGSIGGATVSSIELSSPSPWSRRDGTLMPAPTRHSHMQ